MWARNFPRAVAEAQSLDGTVEVIGTGVPALWAKSNSDSYHPLTHHLLDTAAVAGVLWDRVLSPRLQDRISVTGLGRSGLMLVAGLHDVGKACPGFQSKRFDLAARLPSELSITSPDAALIAGREIPHSIISFDAALQFFAPPIDHDSRTRLAMVAGGHHGVFPDADILARHRVLASGGRAWKRLRQDLCSWVSDQLGVSPLTVALSDADTAVLTGLVITCDWIASNEFWFPYQPSVAASDYHPRAEETAIRAISSMGWERWIPRPATFQERFGFSPRPAQRKVAAASRSDSKPALVIVESETGSGKTEAALDVAAELVLAGKAAGFYVALPTRATSNQMFHRVRKFLEGSSGSKSVGLQLLHGWASLNGAFQTLFERSVVPSQVYDDDLTPRQAAVTAERWFTFRKRGLLAPMGVGTIDSLLMAGLSARHVAVRLFGISDKVIVVDEIHAYDTYMSTLLDRLLEWCGFLQTPVVLLSATLPKRRKEALIAAYHRAPAGQTAHYPSLEIVNGNGEFESEPLNPVGGGRTINLELHSTADPNDVAEVTEEVAALANMGANVLVVANTVSRAQQLAAEAVEKLGNGRVELIHARMLFSDREARQQKIERWFGPGADRPSGMVVVGTQVLEQSLDVDFDVLFTEVAPVDLMLQRVGRVHRHANERPAATSHPRMVVFGFGGPTGFDINRGTSAVYTEWLALRSLAAVTDRASIAIPDDVEDLIECVYSDTHIGPEQLAERLESARHEFEDRRRHFKSEARLRYLPPPQKIGDLDRITNPAVSDTEPWEGTAGRHSKLQALTRLGGESVTVVVTDADPPDVSSPTQIKALLQTSMTLSSPLGLVWTLIDKPTPWPTAGLLRNARHIRLDDEKRASVGSWQVELDAFLGLICERRV